MHKLIKSSKEHAAAMQRLEVLLDADPAAGTPENDELELLVHLIKVYETDNHFIGLPDPIEAIKFRMEQQGLTRKDLVPLIGSISKISEVLSGKRPLSLSMIRRLHEEWGIPAKVLLQGATQHAERVF